MSIPSFAELGVPDPLVRVLAGLNIVEPTPIQVRTLPDSFEGLDVLGRGRTGSGKTFAFLLPVVSFLQQLKEEEGSTRARRPRALILAPTRELASQIDESLKPLARVANLTSVRVFGGVGQGPQVKALANGVDIVVGCPGRIEDLMGQKELKLDDIAVTVLDEADHMADLGFLPGVRRILDATPEDSQRLLFSATLDGAINKLVRDYLHEPVTHEADAIEAPVSTMTHHVLHVNAADHFDVCCELAAAPGRCVIFTRTKHRAKRLCQKLNSAGIPTVELHGNLSQNARERTMDAFRSGKAPTLVATDIAARGIHVDELGLVIHADPPVEHKAYLHRSGRTARAGNSGTVVTLMSDEQKKDVQSLTRKAGIKPTVTRVDAAHPLLQQLAPGARQRPGGWKTEVQPQPQAKKRSKKKGGGSRRRRSRPASRA